MESPCFASFVPYRLLYGRRDGRTKRGDCGLRPSEGGAVVKSLSVKPIKPTLNECPSLSTASEPQTERKRRRDMPDVGEYWMKEDR